MTKTISTYGPKEYVNYTADRPMHVKPIVNNEYLEDNIRMYSTTDGRTFFADAYDRNFSTPIQKVKPKGYKGVNPNKKVAVLK